MQAWIQPNVRDLLGRRWTLEILDFIDRGVTRPAHILKQIKGLNHRLLYDRLKRMHAAGWLTKNDNQSYPQKVEYSLIEKETWGRALQNWRKTKLDWSVASSMLGHKWMPVIIFAANHQPCCFITFKALMPGIPDKVLAEQLHRMQQLGILNQGGRDGRSWLPTPEGTIAFDALSMLAIQASASSKTLKPEKPDYLLRFIR